MEKRSDRVHGHLPRLMRNATPAAATGDLNNSTAGPLMGTSGVWLVVPPHFAAVQERRPFPHGASSRDASAL
ncbi:MAG: hypothetical protein ACRDJW_25245 [Thermomicrobiales bacterium]